MGETVGAAGKTGNPLPPGLDQTQRQDDTKQSSLAKFKSKVSKGFQSMLSNINSGAKKLASLPKSIGSSGISFGQARTVARESMSTNSNVKYNEEMTEKVSSQAKELKGLIGSDLKMEDVSRGADLVRSLRQNIAQAKSDHMDFSAKIIGNFDENTPPVLRSSVNESVYETNKKLGDLDTLLNEVGIDISMPKDQEKLAKVSELLTDIGDVFKGLETDQVSANSAR